MLESAPRRGLVDPQWDRLLQELSQSWDWQQRVAIIGTHASGADVVLRFLASRATLFVRVHVQHNGAGGGGESYDADTFISDVRVDCRASRQQDVTITRATAKDYTVWLVPEFLVDAAQYVRYDGTAGEGEDFMAFTLLGATAFVDIETNLEKWSLMHLAQPYYVPLSGAAITEADKSMMLGLYSGLDYS